MNRSKDNKAIKNFSKGFKIPLEPYKLPSDTLTGMKNIIMRPFINDPLVHELHFAPRLPKERKK